MTTKEGVFILLIILSGTALYYLISAVTGFVRMAVLKRAEKSSASTENEGEMLRKIIANYHSRRGSTRRMGRKRSRRYLHYLYYRQTDPGTSVYQRSPTISEQIWGLRSRAWSSFLGFIVAYVLALLCAMLWISL